MKKFVSVLLAAVLLLSIAASAAIIEPNEDFYYYDSANVLSEVTRGVIFYNNENLREACGAEIVVVAIPTSGSLTTENYAYQLHNSWGVGDKDRDNGMVLLMTIDDDDYYLTQGTGVERIISAEMCKELLDTYLEPYFAAKQYDDGVVALFEQLFTAMRDFYGVNLAFLDTDAVAEKIAANNTESEPYAEYTSDPDDSDSFTTLLALVIVVIAIIVIVSRNKRGHRSAAYVPPIIVTPPRPRRPHFFGGPRMGGSAPGAHRFTQSPSRPSGFGGSSRPSRSSGFGGSSRASRPSSSSRSSGGFGGSSRSSGGGSSRGGGAGRGR